MQSDEQTDIVYELNKTWRVLHQPGKVFVKRMPFFVPYFWLVTHVMFLWATQKLNIEQGKRKEKQKNKQKEEKGEIIWRLIPMK